MCSLYIFLAKNTQKAGSCKVDSFAAADQLLLQLQVHGLWPRLYIKMYSTQFALCLSNQQSLAGWLGVPSSRARLQLDFHINLIASLF